jgi:hypothetical protein
MKHYKLENWCFEAVEKIKYRPDRDVVYTELLQHLDDRCESFLSQGMSKDIAVIRTVEAMGDPKELAPQLAAIHRPFWGFAHRITKWLLCIIAIITVIVISFSVHDYFNTRQPQRNESWVDQSEDPSRTRLLYVEPNCSDSSDGYTFTVTRAAIQKQDDEYQDGKAYTTTYLALELKISNYLPWAGDFLGMRALWGKDNLGTVYANTRNPYSNTQPMYYGTNGHDNFTTYYDFRIEIEDPEALTWFELHYDRDGRDIVLHIDLTGGDEA